MADLSLDDYIQQKKKTVQRKTLNQVTPLRQPLKRPLPTSQPNFDARSKLSTSPATPVVVVRPNQGAKDARQMLLNRKKNDVADARSRISGHKSSASSSIAAVLASNLVSNMTPQPQGLFSRQARSNSLNELVMTVGGQLTKTFTNVASQPQTPLMRTFTQNIQQPCPSSSSNQDQFPVKRPLKSAAIQQLEAKSATPKPAPEPPQVHSSPIQSFRVVVSNLGPNVTQDDVEELFGSCGPMRKIKMNKSGSAEVFYISKESAFNSVNEYHKRELDDKPMNVMISFLQNSQGSEQKPLRSKKQMAAMKQCIELDSSILTQALFKAQNVDQSSVDFTVHL